MTWAQPLTGLHVSASSSTSLRKSKWLSLNQVSTQSWLGECPLVLLTALPTGKWDGEDVAVSLLCKFDQGITLQSCLELLVTPSRCSKNRDYYSTCGKCWKPLSGWPLQLTSFCTSVQPGDCFCMCVCFCAGMMRRRKGAFLEWEERNIGTLWVTSGPLSYPRCDFKGLGANKFSKVP